LEGHLLQQGKATRKMDRLTTAAIGGLLALALFGVAMAGPLEDGIAAAKRGDYATALQLIRPLAKRGDAAAQFSLGGMFDTGKGVSQDPVQAAFWYRKAANQGAPLAQLSLGMMYYTGEGLPQDYSMAAAWLRKAADQGNSEAQHALGVLYDNGNGVPKDSARAALWYRKAADQGDAEAQHSLGSMYFVGEGVPQDYVQAHMWLNLAASRASDAEVRKEMAMFRDHVAAKMTPAQIAEAQRLASEWVPKK
jgi:TPR repeat protein